MGVAGEAEVEVEVEEEEGEEGASWSVELSGVGSRTAVVTFVDVGERGVRPIVVGRGVGVWSMLLLSDRAVPLLEGVISGAPRWLEEVGVGGRSLS